MTQLEYAKLKFSASTYDLTVSNYAKKLALKSNLRKPYKAKEIILELSRQGNNLNQIAHRLSQDDPLTPDLYSTVLSISPKHPYIALFLGLIGFAIYCGCYLQ